MEIRRTKDDGEEESKDAGGVDNTNTPRRGVLVTRKKSGRKKTLLRRGMKKTKKPFHSSAGGEGGLYSGESLRSDLPQSQAPTFAPKSKYVRFIEPVREVREEQEDDEDKRKADFHQRSWERPEKEREAYRMKYNFQDARFYMPEDEDISEKKKKRKVVMAMAPRVFLQQEQHLPPQDLFMTVEWIESAKPDKWPRDPQTDSEFENLYRVDRDEAEQDPRFFPWVEEKPLLGGATLLSSWPGALAPFCLRLWPHQQADKDGKGARSYNGFDDEVLDTIELAEAFLIEAVLPALGSLGCPLRPNSERTVVWLLRPSDFFEEKEDESAPAIQKEEQEEEAEVLKVKGDDGPCFQEEEDDDEQTTVTSEVDPEEVTPPLPTLLQQCSAGSSRSCHRSDCCPCFLPASPQSCKETDLECSFAPLCLASRPAVSLVNVAPEDEAALTCQDEEVPAANSFLRRPPSTPPLQHPLSFPKKSILCERSNARKETQGGATEGEKGGQILASLMTPCTEHMLGSVGEGLEAVAELGAVALERVVLLLSKNKDGPEEPITCWC
ncbi:hypothetical protein CSUI_003519 [Cystoisospora suis]|uniref:Uncharacterized protein n=1 Tax=Cystoisospora suis TaxID=483139 RepID=A0A2C6L554_9APIC|nr:hypothetical protein CSUI_003519 [Cystoisospora suis]